MAEASVLITNRLGLHARAAAKIVRIAAQFPASVIVQTASKKRTADARSILGLLELGARMGDTLVICAEGELAENAVEAIASLVRASFGEFQE